MVFAFAGDSTITSGLGTGPPAPGSSRFLGSRVSDRSPLPISVVSWARRVCQKVVRITRTARWVSCPANAPLRELARPEEPDRHVRDLGTLPHHPHRVGHLPGAAS